MAGRGRPKSDEKRLKILDAAAELFTSKGYERTSLEQVAIEAGVSKQTIYNNFPSKEALLRECIQLRCEEARITGEGLDYSLVPAQFLAMFAERFISTLTEGQPLAMYRLVMTESPRHPEVGLSFYESGPEPIMAALTEYLERATQRGELLMEEPRMASAQFLFMIKGFSMDAALMCLSEESVPYTKAEYVKHCCDAFLRAYKP
jgi:TetR/AcrR family transcriptional repressor of mexJK operon